MCAILRFIYPTESSDFIQKRQGFLLLEVVLGMLLLVAISLMAMMYFSSLVTFYQQAYKQMHTHCYMHRALEEALIEFRRTKQLVNKRYEYGPYSILVHMNRDASTPGFFHVRTFLKEHKDLKDTLYTGTYV